MLDRINNKLEENPQLFFDGGSDPSTDVVPTFSIDQIVDCVCFATASINVLKTDETALEKLNQCFRHYLDHSNPGVWRDQSVATFETPRWAI